MPLDSQTVVTQSSEEASSENLVSLLNAPSEGEEPLVDSGVFDERPEQPPIYKNLPLKAGLAAGAALLLLLPMMYLFSGNLLKSDSSAEELPEEQTEVTEESEEEKALKLSEAENADLKRKLALQSQSFTAAELDEAAAAEQSEAVTDEAVRQPQSQTADAGTVRVSPPAPAPRPIRQAAPLRPASQPVSRSAAPPLATRPLLQSAPIPLLPVDVAAVAAMGNYGQLPADGSSSIQPATQPDAPALMLARETEILESSTIPVSVSRAIPKSNSAVSQASTDGRRSLPRPIPRVMRDQIATEISHSAKVTAPSSEVDLSNYEQERSLIMGEPAANASSSSSVVLPGSRALAVVTNAITWAADMPVAQGSITLTDALTSDGHEIMPAGTELIVQVEAISASGAMALDVVAIVLPAAAGFTEIALPAGALEILAIDGGYPVARAEGSSEQMLRSIDREQALLGAVGAAGGYLNRPSSESSIVGIGGSSISRDYGGGSILGALLEGAANQMLRGRASRLEATAEALRDRPTIWSLEPGTEVQIFVNREVRL